MRVDESLEGAEVSHGGGILGNVFIAALATIWTDAAHSKILETWASVCGWENREAVWTNSIKVEGEKASSWVQAGCGCVSGGGALTRLSGWGGGLVCGGAQSRGAWGGTGIGAAGFATQAGGFRLLVVRFAHVVVADHQVMEVVLPTAEEKGHILEDHGH